MSPADLLEALSVMGDAPEGVAQLRRLVLQLAGRGLLVEQEMEDEPSHELLRRIEKAKLELIRKKKIRTPKGLPPVDESELPHEVPANWCWVRLGQVADYNGREKVESSDLDADSWLLELEDIEKTSSRLLAKHTAGERATKSTKSIFKKGDVLYGKLRPYLDKVLVAEESGACTTEIVPITPFGGLTDSHWLKWSLKRPDFISHVNALSYGVKMPRLGTDDAIASIHPLPPSPSSDASSRRWMS